ncbi:MAG: pyruvate dehydrogenase (acetyl-transferring) E1 component subunit alpha [Chloroflexi bacterium]|nr:pyruvate dehydrogenase (acetyl-transferring) E1 component subunit alpha [Chloroflexota bacterium]
MRPSGDLPLSKVDLLAAYRRMLLIRRFEERAGEAAAQAHIPGSAHLSIGQEGVAVGVCLALRPDDSLTTTHRGHGHVLAKGAEPRYVMAELMGRATGYCKGKGGSLHVADVSHGILGACGIVGGGIPFATGAALGDRLEGRERVTVCFFGEGAANQGTFHESLNMGALWRLPVVYVCENNQYQMTTHSRESTSVADIAVRAASYGMPGVVVAGDDLLAVCEVARTAVDRARRGDGPTLIEAKTYRYRGHSEGIDRILSRPYRPESEVEAWQRQHDPIANFAAWLEHVGLLDATRAARLDEQARAEVEAAARFALESPEPELATVLEDVFATGSLDA